MSALATVFPGKLNEWVFAIRAIPGVAQSDAEILTLVRRVLDPIVPGAGGVDTRLVETSIQPLSPSGHVVAQKEKLPGEAIPTLGAGQTVYARVQFPSRSALTGVPWPMRKVAGGFPLADASLEADILLDMVGSPIGEAGEAPTPLENVLGTELPDIADVPAVAWGTAAAVGLGLFGFMMLTRRARA